MIPGGGFVLASPGDALRSRQAHLKGWENEKIVVTRLDDLDGSEATETVSFGLGEQGHYEIDLSAANAERLRKTFAPLITAGRPVRAARPKRPGRSGPISPAREP